jgi:hypothetical protein
MDETRAFLRSLRAAPTFAHLTAGCTLAIWIMKATWLDFVHVDSRVLVGLGHVVDGLLSAIIAGYVFYIIFAIYPEHRQRRIIAPYLFERIRRIVGDCLAIIEKVEGASGLGLPFKSAREKDVLAAFTATSTSVPPAGIISPAGAPITWLELFTERYGRTVGAIDELFQQGRYLDADIIALLTKIRDAAFYRMSVAAAQAGPMRNQNLDAWGPGFYKLLRLCNELSVWHDDNRPPGVLPMRPNLS